jgi:WD40 repeat protein
LNSSSALLTCPFNTGLHFLQSSQLIEVVTWAQGAPSLIHSLRAHTRSITDIDWHSKKPHLLASCSIDTFTHLWDLRDPRKPILSLSAVCMSGATQVGFNRVSGNLIATAHDGDLRIWVGTHIIRTTKRKMKNFIILGSKKGFLSDPVHNRTPFSDSWHQLEP